MGLKSRISKIEKSGKLEPERKWVTVEVFAQDDTPCDEKQARILKEGQEAKARGENIWWIYVCRPKESGIKKV